MRAVLVTGVCALALSACAKIPAPKDLRTTVSDVPAAWVANPQSEDAVSAEPLSVNWLSTFGDERLVGLVAEMLEYNNNLAQSAARLDASRARARAAFAPFLPTADVSLSGNQTRFNLNQTRITGPLPGGTQSDTLRDMTFGFSASWEIDIWGRIRNEFGAQLNDARAARADYEGAKLSLAANTATSWFGLIEARQQTELARLNVDNRERSLELIQRRFESGLSRSLDLRLAKSDLATARSNLEARKRTEKEAARALEILLGRYPSAQITHGEDLPVLPSLSGIGIPSELVARRPDLQAAERRLQATGLRARAARKALLPTIRLTANYQNSDTVFTDLFDVNRLAGSLAAGLFQPIFQGGRLVANAQASRADAEAALYGYADAALNAFLEVENALTAEARLAAQELALAEAFEQARAAQRITERDYRAGLSTIFNLLDSQTRRFNAESALIQVRRQRLNNRVQLHLALAGPFSTENAQPDRVTFGLPGRSASGGPRP